MDINDERLAYIEKAVKKIVTAGKYPAKVIATKNRASTGRADGVISTILSGGVNVWRHDIEIPKKYGVDINVEIQEVLQEFSELSGLYLICWISAGI